MKKLLLLTTLFITGQLFAQETIILEVQDVTRPDKIHLLHKNDTLKSGNTVGLGKNWDLKIRSTTPLNLRINDFGTGRLDLVNSDSIYQIRNDSVVGKNFKLASGFIVTVVNSRGESAKQFRISLSPAGKTVDPTKTGEHIIGSAVFDAFFLADPTQNNDMQLKILAYYANTVVQEDSIKKAYAGNEFLKKLVDEVIARSKPSAQGALGLSKVFSSLTSSVGGLDVTTIADGFAKFLVKRTKEELNIAFFERFKKFITDPRYIDLQTVFPQTYRALMIIGDEIYNYEAYIQTLRESFENDLSTLDKNLPTIIDNHPVFFTRYPGLAALLNSGCYIAGALDDKVHPGDMLKDYPEDFLDGLNPNVKASVQLVQIMSQSLKDTAINTDSIYWVGSKQLKKLVSRQFTFKVYMGLFYQLVKQQGITFHMRGATLPLTTQLDLVALNFDENYVSYKNYITQFSEKTNHVNELIRNYRKVNSDSLKFEQYHRYFKSSIDILEHAAGLGKLPYLKVVIPDIADSLKDYFDVANSTADLVLDIKRRNYASAVTNTVHIYEVVKARYSTVQTKTLTARQQRKLEETVNNEIADFLKEKSRTPGYTISAEEINELKEEQRSRFKSKLINKTVKDDTLRKLYKYGTFMATVVQAKTSDDVANAIEAFALPTGSSRIKRETAFSVSLNAYTGLFIGHESIKGIKSKKVFNAFGVTAPIGVAVSRGHSIFFIGTGERGWAAGKRGWSTSLFISLVDIGAVAAYRFKDDSTAQVPTIQLKNIFSPGAFISLGIPKTPLSFNMGAQVGPNLRKLKTQAATNEDDNDRVYWRFSTSICVDIPLINFYSKSK